MPRRVPPKEGFERLRDAYRANGERAKARYRSVGALVEGLQVETQIRQFKLTMDEKPAVGGGDEGPNPVEVILSAYGACQEITYKLYAELMGIPLDGITVEVVGDIDLCGFFAASEEARPGYSHIATEVTLDSPASDEDLQRLTQAVHEHCPVLDIIKNATPVSFSIRRKDIRSAAAHAL